MCIKVRRQYVDHDYTCYTQLKNSPLKSNRGHHGHYRIVIEFTTTYVISAFHH